MMAETRRVPPPVRAAQIGTVSGQLESMAQMYRQQHQDRDIRFVYGPEHKSVNSKIVARRAQGYEFVPGKEIGLEGAEGETPARVGDLVMMSMETARREPLIRERAERGVDELKRVEREYYDNLDSAEYETPDGRKLKSSPLGKADIRFIEKEYEILQRSEEEG